MLAMRARERICGTCGISLSDSTAPTRTPTRRRGSAPPPPPPGSSASRARAGTRARALAARRRDAQRARPRSAIRPASPAAAGSRRESYPVAARYPEPRNGTAGMRPGKRRTRDGPRTPSTTGAASRKDAEHGAHADPGEKSREQQQGEITRAAAPAGPLAQHAPQTDRGMHRHREDEQRIEREPGHAAARARKDFGGLEAAAHRGHDGPQRGGDP